MVGPSDVNEKAKEFFYWVGLAITDWAKIDELLFETFSRAINTKRHLAAIIYYRTNTLGGRLTLVDEIICSMIPKRKSGEHAGATETAWKDFKVKMEDLLEVRNQLAHSPANPQAEFSANPTDPSKPAVITDVWWASYITGAEKLRGKGAKSDLKIDDVKDHLAELIRLFVALNIFSGAQLSVLLRESSERESHSP